MKYRLIVSNVGFARIPLELAIEPTKNQQIFVNNDGGSPSQFQIEFIRLTPKTAYVADVFVLLRNVPELMFSSQRVIPAISYEDQYKPGEYD